MIVAIDDWKPGSARKTFTGVMLRASGPKHLACSSNELLWRSQDPSALKRLWMTPKINQFRVLCVSAVALLL
jgi:hypothetical protein